MFGYFIAQEITFIATVALLNENIISSIAVYINTAIYRPIYYFYRSCCFTYVIIMKINLFDRRV